MADTTESFEQLFKEFVNETGANLGGNLRELAEFASNESEQLQAAVGEPGFDRAMKAARDNIALEAGIRAHDQRQDIIGRFFALLTGALTFAAQIR